MVVSPGCGRGIFLGFGLELAVSDLIGGGFGAVLDFGAAPASGNNF